MQNYMEVETRRKSKWQHVLQAKEIWTRSATYV